jgi:hypothetical protein
VVELARDLDTAARREAFSAAVGRLEGEPAVLERLRDRELAWRAYACALLAEALGEDAED